MEMQSHSNGYLSGNSTQISLDQFGKLYLNHSWEPFLLTTLKKIQNKRKRNPKTLNITSIFVMFLFASVSYTSPEFNLIRG